MFIRSTFLHILFVKQEDKRKNQSNGMDFFYIKNTNYFLNSTLSGLIT